MAHTPGVFKHNSWGRTRGPKNLVNLNHETPQSVVFTAIGDGDVQTGLAVSNAANGTRSELLTENQRFLHITYTTTDDDAGCVIALEVYTHASGVWSTLDSWSNLTATTTTKHSVTEIYGVDKVRFRISGVKDTATCTIHPAGSTF